MGFCIYLCHLIVTEVVTYVTVHIVYQLGREVHIIGQIHRLHNQLSLGPFQSYPETFVPIDIVQGIGHHVNIVLPGIIFFQFRSCQVFAQRLVALQVPPHHQGIASVRQSIREGQTVLLLVSFYLKGTLLLHQLARLGVIKGIEQS